MISITVIILSVAIFSAMVINMALKPAYSARLTAVLMLVAACGGSVIYGMGYTYVTQNIALSLVRTPFSVIGMYLGKNDLSAISGSPIVSTSVGIFCFWTLHLFAFYSIASAAMISVGAEGLRRLRLFLAMSGDLTIIYGINEESIDVGRECHASNGASVVFITETEPPGAASEIAGLGMAVLSGVAAAKSEEQALRKLRVRHRKKIDVYALDENSNDSLFYAIGLKEAFGKIGVDPRITSVTVPGTEEIVTSMLQISPDTYGFGFVNVFDSTELAARAMIRLCPPWEFLTFDDVKIYYDNGQVEVSRLLSSVFNALLPNPIFRKVMPTDYKLFQVADFICTMELVSLKLENSLFSKSEMTFFGNKRDFKLSIGRCCCLAHFGMYHRLGISTSCYQSGESQ